MYTSTLWRDDSNMLFIWNFMLRQQGSQQSSDEIYPKINIYESFKSWIFSIYLYKED